MKSNTIYKLITFLCCILPLTLQAQSNSVTISGTVTDDFGPVFGAHVVEIDDGQRIIESAVTDMNGNFAMKVRSTKNKVKFSYVGCKTQLLSIGERRLFDIFLESENLIEEVVVTAATRVATGGLDIPEREQSFSQQTMSMSKLEGLSFTSVDEALQGQIAGLDIVSNSGNLGSGTSMRLRGVSSIFSSSEPLIVVDGNIFETDANSGVDYSSITEDKFAELLSINVEDIASITVLKDAAATAIWGSQGSNGVISIVTKRGTSGKPRVSYALRLRGTYQPEGYEMLNGDQYTMLMKEEFFNATQNPERLEELSYNQNFPQYEQYNNNTDWQDAVKQFGLFQSHHLSISGGGEKANYRISAGYDHQEGSIIAQQLDRFSTRMALDYFVNDRIRISSSFALTYTDNEQNSDGLLSIAIIKMPNMAIYDEDALGNSLGTYFRMDEFVEAYSGDKDELSAQRSLVNPVASAWLAQKRNRSYNVAPTFDINYKLLGVDEEKTQLNYTGSVALSILNGYNDSYYPFELKSVKWTETQGAVNSASSSFNKSFGFTTTHRLTFIPALSNKNHSIRTMLQGQVVTGNSNSQSLSSYMLPGANITMAATGGHLSTTTTGSGQWRSANWVLQAHYSYKSKYSLDWSMRADGSTRFGPSHRWGYFYAASGRWNVIDEAFMESTREWMSMLSVRAGWGITGTQPGSNDLHYSIYQSDGKYINTPGMRPANIRLTDLRWEKQNSWNTGVDLGLMDNLLTASVNLYAQYKSDLLTKNPSIPTTSGFATLNYENNGKMKNQGYEINLNVNRFKLVGKLQASTYLNFANNRNTITEMDEIRLNAINGTGVKLPTNGNYVTRVQLNNPFGAIYGLRYKGVYAYSYDHYDKAIAEGASCPVARDKDGNVIYGADNKPMQLYYDYDNTKYAFTGGDAIYEDINHDGNINELDLVYLGSSLPKLTGGFGFNLYYKAWTLKAMFNYRYGNKVVNKARMLAENMYGTNNQTTTVNYRWRKEGDGADGSHIVPRALYAKGYNWLGSDRYVEDASFIRLNNLQISYEVDRDFCKRLGMSRIALFASADNLFLLTRYSGVDPEVGYGGMGVTMDNAATPRAKSFTLGATINF